MSDATRDFFDTLAKVLLRCWIFGFVLLYLWFALDMLAGGAMYRLQAGLFGVSRHEMDLVFYCGIAWVKLTVILFFLFPWAAIRLVLRKAKTK